MYSINMNKIQGYYTVWQMNLTSPVEQEQYVVIEYFIEEKLYTEIYNYYRNMHCLALKYIIHNILHKYLALAAFWTKQSKTTVLYCIVMYFKL